MLRVAACAVLLAGCDAVFGLSTLPAPPDADTTDAPPDQLLVTGSYKQIYVANGADGLPVVAERVLAIDQVSFAAVLDDGTSVDVTYNATDGTFSFPIARIGQPYQFSYTADGARGEFQTDTSQLRIGAMLAGRPNRRPLQIATVTFGYPAYNGGNYGAHVASTGIYTLSSTNQFNSVSFDWRLSSPAPGAQLGLLDASEHDRIYAIEPVVDNSVPTLPYTSYRSVSSAAITQLPGGTVPIPGPAPVAKNGCVRMNAASGTEYARMTAAHPRSYTGTAADWVVYSAPAADRLGVIGAHWVAICGYTPVRDIDIAPTFHDPYPGTKLIAEAAATALFNLQLPNAAPLQLGNITRRYRPAERGTTTCNGAKTVLDTEVALLGNFALDGMPIDADGKKVSLDLSRDPRLTWEIVAPGKLEFVSVSLHEVQNVNGTTAVLHRGSLALANVPYAVIDRSLLAPGGKYNFVVTSSLGRPNVQNGDWEVIQMPFENASVWSYYFEVQ